MDGTSRESGYLNWQAETERIHSFRRKVHTKDNCNKAGERKDLSAREAHAGIASPVRRQLIPIASLMVCEAARGRYELLR